jgi:acyl carrier protein
MSLIALLEQEFDFMMDMDDVIDFGSYTKGIELLRKYDIEI